VARRFGQYAVQHHEDRASAPLNKDWDRKCRRRATKVQGYRTAALAAKIIVIRLTSRRVTFTIRVVIAAVRENRCGQTIRIFRVTGAKGSKHDIQYKRDRGDENARFSPAVPINVHLFGCYNPIMRTNIPHQSFDGRPAHHFITHLAVKQFGGTFSPNGGTGLK
jgi:hypothetical protein